MARFDELFQKLHEAESLGHRIEGINQDAQGFAEDVSALIKQLAPDLLAMPPAQAAAELQALLSQAQADAATEAALRKQLKEKQHIIRVSQDTIRLMTESLAKLCRQAGCQKHEELESLEERSNQYQSLQKDLTTWRSRSWSWPPGPPWKRPAGRRPR